MKMLRPKELIGILKQEYGLGATFNSKNQVRKAFAQAVYLYNNCRPHQALAYQIPSKVHANEPVPAA